MAFKKWSLFIWYHLLGFHGPHSFVLFHHMLQILTRNKNLKYRCQFLRLDTLFREMG